MEPNFAKQFFYSLGVFALIFFWTNVFWDYSGELVSRIKGPKLATVSEVVNIVDKKEPVVEKPNIKLAFVGDIMLDRGVKYSVNKNLGGDYGELFSKVKDQLQSYDYLFGNLEGPISDKGSDGGNLYSFRFEPKVVSVLKEAGFDIFSVANNHIFNWGIEAFKDTLENLSDANINYVGGGSSGGDAYQEKIVDIKGLKVAFLAFSEFKEGAVSATSSKAGIALISEEQVKNEVSQVRSAADLVIVSFHFGDEYEDSPNTFQRKYAKLAIDAGADLIVGHHPHVVENPEQYKNSWIAYSLGNFIFDQNFSDKTMWGGLLEVEVNPADKLIEKVTLKKVNLNRMFQVESIE